MYVYMSTRDVPVTSRGHEADFSDGSAFQSFFGRRLYSRLLWLGPPERSHPEVSGLSTPGRGRNEEGVERPFPAVSSRLTGALPAGPPSEASGIRAPAGSSLLPDQPDKAGGSFYFYMISKETRSHPSWK